jgi:hypothetical protein
MDNKSEPDGSRVGLHSHSRVSDVDHTGRRQDHTGGLRLVLLTMRPPRVVTPGGCQIGGCADRTGCRQLVPLTMRPARVVTPG